MWHDDEAKMTHIVSDLVFTDAIIFFPINVIFSFTDVIDYYCSTFSSNWIKYLVDHYADISSSESINFRDSICRLKDLGSGVGSEIKIQGKSIWFSERDSEKLREIQGS